MYSDKYLLLTSNECAYEKKVPWVEWYIGQIPRVRYFLNSRELSVDKIIYLDPAQDFFLKNHGKVQWGYKAYRYYGNGRQLMPTHFSSMLVVYNDIIITFSSDKNHFKYINESSGQHIITLKPNLIIEEPNGILPLRLDRNDLDADRLPFEDELLQDISKDFIAQLLNLPFDPKAIDDIDVRENNKIEPHYTDFLFSKKGFTLTSDYFLKKIPLDFNILKVTTSLHRYCKFDTSPIFEFSDDIMVYPVFADSEIFSKSHFNDAGHCILLKKGRHEKQLFSSTDQKFKIKWENENYAVYNYNDDKRESGIFDKEKVLPIMNTLGAEVLAIEEVPLGIINKLKGGKILDKLFEKYFGNNFIIPYDLQERKTHYKKAFDELKDYMKDYEKKELR